MRGNDEIPARDDERPDVDVVHPDPGLGEHRAVEEDGDPDERRQDRRREEPPCEKHEKEGENRGEDHSGESPRQCMPPRLDDVRPRRAGHNELVALAIDAQKTPANQDRDVR